MKTAAIVRLLVAVAVPNTATGCFSVVGVRGPPAPCTEHYLGPVVDTAIATAGGAVAVTRLIQFNRDPFGGEADMKIDIGAGVTLLVAGGISAAIGYYKVNACRKSIRPSPDDPPPPPFPLEIDREQAWTLFERAVVAAHESDCVTVMKIGPQILIFDSEFHRTIFLSNVAIQRCVESDAASPIDPAQPVQR